MAEKFMDPTLVIYILYYSTTAEDTPTLEEDMMTA